MDLVVPSSISLGISGTLAFRARWRAVLAFFGLDPASGVRGPTPGALRGSGATFFYFYTVDLPRLMWRGRWRSTSTVERYLQEAAAQTYLCGLPQAVRERILFFSRSAGAVIHAFADGYLPGNRQAPSSSLPVLSPFRGKVVDMELDSGSDEASSFSG